MWRPSYFKRETPAAFQPAAADTDDLFGKGFTVELDRENPIENIIIDLNMIVSTAFATPTADFVFNLIKNIQLYCQTPKRSGNIVDTTGMFLIEYWEQLNGQSDRWTNSAMAECNKATPTIQVASHRLRYVIPLLHPLFDGPLALLGTLNAHEHASKPQLKIQFGTITDCGSAGAVSDFRASVFTQRRALSGADKQSLAGQFLDFDLVENVLQCPLSYAGKIEAPINGPGGLANLMLRHYLGGAAVTRADISGQPTASGKEETLWTLAENNQPFTEFPMHLLQCVNDWSRCKDSGRAAQPGDTLAAATQGHGPHSVMYDFLSDHGRPITDLSTLLDLDGPFRRGTQVKLVGTCASAATNASKLYYGGHRYYDVPAKFKATL